MEKENVCVFCGQRPGAFRSTSVYCGGTWQSACKSCEKELKGISEEEVCRRALRRGLAAEAQRIEAHLKVVEEAELHRPKCLQCGSKLVFGEVEELDNSPLRDGLLSTTFDVLPAHCPSCGRFEFYDPVIAKRNPHLAHLIAKDNQE